MEIIKYGPDNKDGYLFGSGVNFDLHDTQFSPEEAYQKALSYGWSNGCPIARELCDPTNEQYGPEKMIKRYSETNWMFLITQAQAHQTGNIILTADLLAKRSRLNKVGKHEPESVPASHINQMAPMAHIYGYAIPRVLVEYNRTNYQGARALMRQDRFLELLKNLVKNTQQADQLLIESSYAAIKDGVESVRVFQHIFASGVLEEERCLNDFQKTANLMDEWHPEIMREYAAIPDDEKATLGISPIS